MSANLVTMTESKERAGEKRRKRVITDARKEQNRAAARAYRQRQKESRENFMGRSQRLRGGRQELRPRLPLRLEADTPATTTQDTSDHETAQAQETIGMGTINADPEIDSILHPIGSFQTLQPNTFQDENFGFNEVVEGFFVPTLNLNNPHFVLDPLDVESGSNSSLAMFDYGNSETPSNDPISTMSATHHDQMGELSMLSTLYASHHVPTLRSRFQSHILQLSDKPHALVDSSVRQDLEGLEQPLSGELSFASDNSVDICSLDFSTTPVADPHINYIQLSSVATFSACLRNALSLGIKLQDLMTSKCCSPFYRPTTPTDDPKVLLASAYVSSVPAHLQPTLPQILFPHHAYLDLLPFPVLRARAIALAATNPQLFNPIDVKIDMIEGGLICWRAGHDKDNGNGQPWDMRSWEAAPWFLRKWKMLIGGEEGEIWKQSVRWQKVRGMAPDPIRLAAHRSSFASGSCIG